MTLFSLESESILASYKVPATERQIKNKKKKKTLRDLLTSLVFVGELLSSMRRRVLAM